MTKKELVSITFKTTPEFKEQLKELSELETRKISQTIQHYLKPVIIKRLNELKEQD